MKNPFTAEDVLCRFTQARWESWVLLLLKTIENESDKSAYEKALERLEDKILARQEQGHW